MVHDELCERLTKEDERIRLDAMRKVAALNLMTAQLLPAFLTCFGDPHISVKIEAASVSVTFLETSIYRSTKENKKCDIFTYIYAYVGSCRNVTEK